VPTQLRALLVAVAAAVLTLAASAACADVVVRVEVKEVSPKADPVTTLSVETLAGAGGQFSATTTVSKQTVTLKGGLKKSDDGPYRVQVNFSRRGDDGGQQISTSIVLPLNKPHEIGGLSSAGGERKVVLTLEDAPAK
jgi:opacity protein-like surface antigen